MADPRHLYEPMLERDLERTRSRAREFADTHGAIDLFHAVSRFAALAFSPSQHGRHAFVATLSAWALREPAGDLWPRLLAECAVYAAEGRLPWSEAPLFDPPPLEPGERANREGLRSALRDRDRGRATRWLGARTSAADLIGDFFDAAAADLGDAGHSMIVSTAAWKLSLLQDSHPSFAALRPAAEEWTAKHEADAQPPEPAEPPGSDLRNSAEASENRSSDPGSIVSEMIEAVVARGGEPESFHDLALLDAALEAGELGAPAGAVERAVAVAMARIRSRPAPAEPPRIGEGKIGEAPLYPLARDWGGLLKAHAIALRTERWAGRARVRRLLAAAEYNLRTSSFDQWSFA